MSLAVAHLPSVLAWLDRHAESLDVGTAHAADVLPKLASAGYLRVGVPKAAGGDGGDIADAVAAVAAVAERSLVAAFVLWSQRSYTEYLLRTGNAALRADLPALLDGRLAGVSGLSNAIKHLAGLEPLGVRATDGACGWWIEGRLPWVTNARPGGFAVAVAAERPDGTAAVVALRHDDPGVRRTADLDLMALRGSCTAALELDGVDVRPERIVHPDLRAWLPGIRPALIGMQAGLAIGLARRCLAEAGQAGGGAGAILAEPAARASARLEALAAELAAGLRDGRFVAAPRRLFALRIALAEIVGDAAMLELKAKGGGAYLSAAGDGFARRWREAAFIPIVTPSVVQLAAAVARVGDGA